MLKPNKSRGVQDVKLSLSEYGEYLLNVTFMKEDENNNIYEHKVFNIHTGIYINDDVKLNIYQHTPWGVSECDISFERGYLTYQVDTSEKFTLSNFVKTNFDEYTIKELEEKLGHRIKIVDKKE